MPVKGKKSSPKYSNKQLGHRKCQTIKYKRITVINNKRINTSLLPLATIQITALVLIVSKPIIEGISILLKYLYN